METRSGRLVAESEHEEVRLVVEAAAAFHPKGNALAGSTEAEHADGRVVAEAAEAAAILDLDDDAEHEEGRLVKDAAETAAATA